MNPAPVDREATAEQAASDWLALADAARIEDSWAAASSLFRHTLTPTSWSLEYLAVRACLGHVRSRRLIGTRATRHMVGAPAANYLVMRYRTVFGGETAPLDERVTLMEESDGCWRVAGYYVPSPWAPRRRTAGSNKLMGQPLAAA
jgi:hypothetical protein